MSHGNVFMWHFQLQRNTFYCYTAHQTTCYCIHAVLLFLVGYDQCSTKRYQCSHQSRATVCWCLLAATSGECFVKSSPASDRWSEFIASAEERSCSCTQVTVSYCIWCDIVRSADLDSRLAYSRPRPRLAYPRPRPRLSSFKTKTKTKTSMSKTKTETQDLQHQYWKSMTGMNCDKQKVMANRKSSIPVVAHSKQKTSYYV